MPLITAKKQNPITQNPPIALCPKKGVLVVRMQNKQKFLFTKFWLPVLLCMAVIFFVSSVAGSDIPRLFRFQDKIYHFLIYLILGLCYSRAIDNTFLRLSMVKLIVFTIIFGFIYGASDEFHQSFVPYRDASVFDVLTDTMGCFAGSLVYFLSKKFIYD